MSDDTVKQEFTSMTLHRMRGVKLISSTIAVEIAGLLLKETYGQREFERNEPLAVIEDGECWVVQGKSSFGQTDKDPQVSVWTGPLRMRISQWDGQILDFIFLLDMTRASQAASSETGH